MSLIASLLVSLSIAASPLSAPSSFPVATVGEAEEILMDACLQNPKNKPANCTCVLTTLKKETDPRDYKLMMETLTLVMTGSGDDIIDKAIEDDWSILQFLAFAERMKKVTGYIDQTCGQEIHLDLKLGADPGEKV